MMDGSYLVDVSKVSLTKPKTLEPRPSTLIFESKCDVSYLVDASEVSLPKPQTLNPQHSTLNLEGRFEPS